LNSSSRRVLNSPWLFLAPILIPFVLFLLLPVLEVVRLSFHRWDWFEEEWVGLAQYALLFTDPDYLRAMLHTVAFALVVVPAWIVLTLVIATLISPLRPPARRRWTTLFYLPYLVSPVVLAIVWTWMLAPESDGLVNRMLGLFGVGPVALLASPKWAMACVILSTAVTIPGSGVMLYGAAISALPEELYEAARIEGAGRWAQWRLITLPLLRPTTLYLTVIYTIASFQVFERVYIMTGGGPAGSTTVMVHRIYTSAFQSFDFGGAAAESVVLLLMIGAVAWAQFGAMRSQTQY
jgi:multiple sugar transport system permease protein